MTTQVRIMVETVHTRALEADENQRNFIIILGAMRVAITDKRTAIKNVQSAMAGAWQFCLFSTPIRADSAKRCDRSVAAAGSNSTLLTVCAHRCVSWIWLQLVFFSRQSHPRFFAADPGTGGTGDDCLPQTATASTPGSWSGFGLCL